MIDGCQDGKAERISAHLPIKSRGLEERQAELSRVLLHLRRGVRQTIVWIRAWWCRQLDPQRSLYGSSTDAERPREDGRDVSRVGGLRKWLTGNKGSAGGSRPRKVPNLRGSHLNFKQYTGFYLEHSMTPFVGPIVWLALVPKSGHWNEQKTPFLFSVWKHAGHWYSSENSAKPAGTILLTKGRAGRFLVLTGKTRHV